MGSEKFDKEMEDMMTDSRSKVDRLKESGQLGGKLRADEELATENQETAREHRNQRARDRAFYLKEKERLRKLTEGEVERRK